MSEKDQEKPAVPAETSDAAPTPAPASTPASKEEPLRLPRGALIALRKSGGLHFTSRTVIVFPDGRLMYDEKQSRERYALPQRKLGDAQIVRLRRLIQTTDFLRMEPPGGQPSPDGFTYELAAKLNNRSNELEVFDGSVPPTLQPLIDALVKLLPEVEPPK